MEYNERLLSIIDARIAAARLKTVDLGTIQDRDAVGPGATCVFDGTSDAQPVKVPGHVHAFGGDRVVLILVKGNWVVEGTFNRRQLAESNVRVFGPSPSQTTTSATFVDMPGATTPSVAFLKRYDLTAVRFGLLAHMFVTVQPTVVQTAVRIAGTTGTDTASTFTPIDVVSGQLNFNVTGTHLPLAGWARAVSIPAGSYTLTARWRRISGTGVLTVDQNDLIALEVDEIFRTTEV
jgi:hypothetical protein